MDPVPVIQAALHLSHRSIQFDRTGDWEAAVKAYYETMTLIDKAISIIATTDNPQIPLDRILKKKLKYSRRVSKLLDSNRTKSVYLKVPVVGKSDILPYAGFVDFHASFLTSIARRRSIWVPYSTDPFIYPFERLARIALSIKTGAYLTETLYVCADVWAQTSLKVDQEELKHSSFTMMQKPLLTLYAIQRVLAYLTKSDPQMADLQPFFNLFGELMTDISLITALLSKKLKYLPSANDDSVSVPSWAKISFFKPAKTTYRHSLFDFVDICSVIFLDLIEISKKNKDVAVIRTAMQPIVDFVTITLLKVLDKDVEFAVKRYVKKIKRVIQV